MASAEDSAGQDAEGLAAMIARAAQSRGGGRDSLPPVERWNPSFCGEIDMEINAEGQWFYRGSLIAREALVRLFSTVLRKDEDGKTYLVTPVEKLEIRVVDAAFLAVEMAVAGLPGEEKLVFRTSLGDVVEAGEDHPLRFSGGQDEWLAYVHIRGRLEAKLSRALMYELAERGEVLELYGRDMFCLRSGGSLFPVMPAEELDLPT